MEKARKSRTPEVMLSQNLTRSITVKTRRIEGETQEYIKNALMATDEKSKKHS